MGNAAKDTFWNEVQDQIRESNAEKFAKMEEDHAKTTEAIQGHCRRWEDDYKAGYHEALVLYSGWVMTLVNAVPSCSDAIQGVLDLPVSPSNLSPVSVSKALQAILALNKTRHEAWGKFQSCVSVWDDVPDVFASRPDLQNLQKDAAFATKAIETLERLEISTKIARVHPVTVEPYQSAIRTLSSDYSEKLQQYEQSQ